MTHYLKDGDAAKALVDGQDSTGKIWHRGNSVCNHMFVPASDLAQEMPSSQVLSTCRGANSLTGDNLLDGLSA
jgi:hypothetical protein